MRVNKEKKTNDKVEALAASIRKKYLALKLGKSEVDEEVQKFFKPLVEPLNLLVKNTSDGNSYVTRYPGRRKQPVPPPMKASTPERKSLADVTMSTIVEPPSQPTEIKHPIEETFVYKPEEEEEVFKPNSTLQNVARGVSRQSLGEYLAQYPDLAQEYIDRYIEDPDLFDGTYGLVNDPELEKWSMGSKEVTFNKDNSITIDGKQYPGTKGLYELLFMKEPEDKYIKKQDLTFYKDILERTCAHRHGFTPIGGIRGTNLQKYKVYVKPLVNPAKSGIARPTRGSSSSSIPSPSGRPRGKGMSFNYKIVNKRPVDYMYWNSLNELVDRLRIIYAEIIAGNKAHWNEAASIIEELLETGKIYKLRKSSSSLFTQQ